MEIKLNHVSLELKQGHFEKAKSLSHVIFYRFCLNSGMFPVSIVLGWILRYGRPKSATEMTFTKAFLPGYA